MEPYHLEMVTCSLINPAYIKIYAFNGRFLYLPVLPARIPENMEIARKIGILVDIVFKCVIVANGAYLLRSFGEPHARSYCPDYPCHHRCRFDPRIRRPHYEPTDIQSSYIQLAGAQLADSSAEYHTDDQDGDRKSNLVDQSCAAVQLRRPTLYAELQ